MRFQEGPRRGESHANLHTRSTIHIKTTRKKKNQRKNAYLHNQKAYTLDQFWKNTNTNIIDNNNEPIEPASIRDTPRADDRADDKNERYGDLMKVKPKGTFRIGFQNIHNMSKNGNTAQHKAMVRHLKEGDYDIMMMSEIGLYWPNVPARDSWAERSLFDLPNSGSVFAYNQTERLPPSGIRQFGGTGIVASAEAAARVKAKGRDLSLLGRWSWMTIQGKEGHTTVVISAYRPVKNVEYIGSVYQQHTRSLIKRNDMREPLKAFDEDLHQQIKKWIDQGYHIILGMDANTKLDGTSDIEKRLFELGLENIFLKEATPKFGSQPATCNKSEHQLPIDGVWASPTIVPDKLGFHAFDDAIPSDHRCLWVDISFSILFGHRSPPLQKGFTRRLSVKDPRVVHKYIKKVRERFKAGKLFERVQRLASIQQDSWTQEHETEYNAIHIQSTSIRLAVEKDLRTLKMGGVQWSPKLQKYRDAIELWRMVLKRKKGLRCSLTRIRRFMRKTGLQEALKSDMMETQAKLKQAYQDYKEARKRAESWRNDYLESLVDALAAKNQVLREKQMRQLRLNERQRRLARSSKRSRGKLGKSKVTKVWYTDDQGVRHEASTKLSMEVAITQENMQRFRQTEGTPPMLRAFLDLVGSVGELPTLELILQGYPIWESLEEDIPPFTKEFLTCLKRPARVTIASPADVSTDDHCRAWRQQTEKTASEPTAPSFSHFKAAIEDEELALFDSIMRSLPYSHGFSPTLWQLITDVSILKKAGVYDVEKMRTIQLMHPEFNVNNKKLGREAMKRAEAFGIIPPDQYGSRKRHRCVRAALNKRLTMDIVRQSRRPAALCSNDAKSCYDRIVHWVATAAIQRTGLDPAPAISMFSTLQKAQHHVSTGYGIADKGYSANQFFPMQGVGQGNGCGPAVWALISAVLIDMMYRAGHGCQLVSPLSQSLLSFVGYAFVDDTDLVQIGETWQTGEDVAKNMQQALDRWEGGLRASGGALVPKKSHWYLIDFIWRNSWQYRSIPHMPASLSVIDTDGSARVSLKRHPTNHAEETLGVLLAMDGNNKGAIAHLRRKAETIAATAQSSPMAPDEAWYTLESSVMKTFEYPLEALTIDREQWQSILAPVLATYLPKARIDRNLPRELVYGSKGQMALGLLHPGLHQQVLHVCALVEEGRKAHSLTGQHMRWSAEALAVEVGVVGNFFSHNYYRYESIVTSCWMATIWKFCTDYSIHLFHPLPVLECPCGPHDQSLTECFSSRYHGQVLHQLNLCRLYLRVVFLSDICTMDGKRISQESWTGVRRQDRYNQVSTWPRAMKPPRTWWIRWQEAIQSCFCSDAQVLRNPVLMAMPSTRWHWWFDPSQRHLFHLEGHMWRRFQANKASVRVRSTTFHPCELWSGDCIIHACVPVVVIRQGRGAVVDAQGIPDCHTTVHPRTPLPITGHYDSWVADEVDVSHGTLAQLAQHFSTHKSLICINDGSYKDPFTTCASAVTDGSDVVVLGTSVVPGNADEGSAYRGELGGIITTLELVSQVLALLPHQHRNGSIVIYLDGHSAMTQSRDVLLANPSNRSFDLLQEIDTRVRELPCTIDWRWVKGHDDLADTSPWETRMNHLCDSLAKRRLKEYSEHYDMPPQWQENPVGWGVQLGDRRLSSISRMPIYDWVIDQTELSPTKYWIKKHGMQGKDDINWDARSKACKRLTQSQRIWLVKHWSGWCAVGKRACMRGHQQHAQCPRCDCQVETSIHVLACQGQGAAALWRSLLLKLAVWLDSVQTAPFITDSITQGLTHWYSGEMFQGVQHTTYEAQESLGWTAFLQGYHSQLWSREQHQWYTNIGSSRSADRWASLLVEKIWMIGKDMWLHRNEVCHGPNRLQPLDLRRDLEEQAKAVEEQVLALDIEEVPSLGRLELCSNHRLEIWIEGARGMLRRKQQQQVEPSSTDPMLTGMRKTMASWLGKALH